jgi:hypothetical protein
MVATLSHPDRSRRTSPQAVRRLLLEIAYQVHATRVVKRVPAKDGRRPGSVRLTS